MRSALRFARPGRLAFALVLLLAFVLAGGLPGTSETRTGHEFHYYSDATHAHPVGDCIVCIGFSHCTGTVTPYYTISNYPCM
jgi:hypothetical protein